MKAIMTGTIAGGFSITRIVEDDEAEDVVVRLMADGQMAEALDVEDPGSLNKCAPAAALCGSHFVVYGKGLGNGFSMYGPFSDNDTAEEFAEGNRGEDEEWELFEFDWAPRYVHGSWTHIFHDSGPDVETRIVFDRQAEKLLALDIKRATGWRKASPVEFADVEDSIKNANKEALDDPEEFGLEQSDTLPDWCSAT
jgi:hypothetical protein